MIFTLSIYMTYDLFWSLLILWLLASPSKFVRIKCPSWSTRSQKRERKYCCCCCLESNVHSIRDSYMSSFISPDYPDFLLCSLLLLTTKLKVPKVTWHVALLTPRGERSEVSVKPKLSLISESLLAQLITKTCRVTQFSDSALKVHLPCTQ